jgi:WD40 repeat protein
MRKGAMTPLLLTAALLQPAPRLDTYGDPLPEGAVARLGTTRLRPGGLVSALAFTPDGKQLVTANHVTGVHVWDTATGKELRAWHPKDTVVALSPDGSLAVTAGDTVRVCKVADGAVLSELGDGNSYMELVFSADARLLAALDKNGRAEIRAAATGKLLHTLPCRGRHMAFAPDGRSVAVAVEPGVMVVIELATGKQRVRLGAGMADSHYSALAFAPDGKTLAALIDDRCRIECWDVQTGQLRSTPKTSFTAIDRLVFTPDSRHVVAGDGRRQVCLWDVATGKITQQLPDLTGNLPAAVVSPDGTLLATGGVAVRLWRLKDGKQVPDFGGTPGDALGVGAAVFTADSKGLRTCHWVHRPGGLRWGVCSWDAAAGKLIGAVEHPYPEGKWTDLARDGSAVAAADESTFEVRDLATNKVLLRREQKAGTIVRLSLRHDGKYLAVHRLGDGQPHAVELELWDVATGKVVLQLDRFDQRSIAHFSPDGQCLFLLVPKGDRKQLVTVFDVATGRRVSRKCVVPAASTVVPSPDGRLLAVADKISDTVLLYETVTSKAVVRLQTKAQFVTTLAISPDARLLAAGTNSGEVLLFDVLTGEVLTTWRGHPGWSFLLAWSPDSTRLATSGDEGGVVIWDASPWQRKLRAAEGKLTAAEAETLWAELASADAQRGWPAAVKLARAPNAAVALLKELRPAAAGDVAALKAWLAAVGSHKPAVRQAAVAELARAAELALPLIEQTLAAGPPPEVRQRLEDLRRKLEEPLAPPPEVLRLGRALRVLEWIGNDQARALLAELAGGADGAWLTVEARAAVKRLARNQE